MATFLDDLFPGLSNVGAEVGAELKHMGAQGAHELAAALFSGSSFVMYPRGQHDDGPGIHGQEGQEHQQEHAGREM